MQRTEAERPHLDADASPFGKGALELQRDPRGLVPGPLRGDHGLVPGQTPQGEVERAGGGPIEPLQVVDGNDDRSRFRKAPEDGGGSRADPPVIEPAPAGVLAEQGDRDRAPLRLRQLREHLVRYGPEQVAEGGEGQP